MRDPTQGTACCAAGTTSVREHYTQMVWRGTTRIGAGKAVIASGPYKGLTVPVCNYTPRGNMIGQKPY